MVVKVPTVSYASLMQRYNVTSLHLLKIDTEGFDVFILRQMLNWGKISSQYPERVQFERNNLTDVRKSDDLFLALQAVYDCWAPITEDDVQCLRLRDIAAFSGGFRNPLAFSGRTHGSMSVPWWRMELPDRLTVAFVQWKLHDADAFEVTVGDSPDVHQNHRCKAQNRRNDGDEGMVAVCGLEGRYVAFVGSASVEVLQNVKVLVPQSDQGAFRLSTGRVCCHRGCQKDTKLFEGYDPRCEERCRSDAECRFFTSFSSLWCITYADCDEELLSLAASTTFGLTSQDLLPLPLHQARQSSLDWGGEASRAIDGVFDPHFLAGSCSHTAEDAELDGSKALMFCICIYVYYI